jgi:glutamate 5-kinase
VRRITPEIVAMAGGSNDAAGVGSGGMATKLDAARIAMTAGCATAIMLGAVDGAVDGAGPIAAVAAGARATWFLPEITPETARRQWLAGALKPAGSVMVDAGAAKALKAGKSLLAAGVTAVSGRFERGDAVSVTDPDGAVLARGVSAYSSDDAARLIGRKSDEFEAILGYRGRPALIHVDDLVLV